MGSDHRTTSPGIGDGIKNLLRRAARVQRVDPLIPVGWPVRDEAEAQEVWSFLSEEIEHRWNGSIPDPLVEDDGTLRPTLIGLWSEGRLIGGAFVRPAIEEAAGFAANGWENAAQVVRERVCVTEAIAVRRECRGKGIGLQIKGYCDAWAREHHALLMLSIPTNDGARHLNEKAGHTVLDTDVSMVLQFTCDGKPVTGGVTFHREQTEGYSAWAFKVLAKTHGAALRVGQCPHPAVEASTEDHNSIIRLDGTGEAPKIDTIA
ncbi:GNAT family N-acetyltransferase [Bifidobacterium moukalabense]|uniref:GNAT family N-acetyltransferase n=1 Tax=Bifidobacterium moukalabense TaxID=1333651 RepID=UPI0010F8A4BB|nr:GNAT family N-acetyltransferase [Bifidobacterium moukalabense]